MYNLTCLHPWSMSHSTVDRLRARSSHLWTEALFRLTCSLGSGHASNWARHSRQYRKSCPELSGPSGLMRAFELSRRRRLFLRKVSSGDTTRGHALLVHVPAALWECWAQSYRWTYQRHCVSAGPKGSTRERAPRAVRRTRGLAGRGTVVVTGIPTGNFKTAGVLSRVSLVPYSVSEQVVRRWQVAWTSITRCPRSWLRLVCCAVFPPRSLLFRCLSPGLLPSWPVNTKLSRICGKASSGISSLLVSRFTHRTVCARVKESLLFHAKADVSFGATVVTCKPMTCGPAEAQHVQTVGSSSGDSPTSPAISGPHGS